MISLVLPITREEPALIDTLAAFVPGVAEGVIRDAIMVSSIQTPAIEHIADAAGCKLLVASGDRPALIRAALAQARCDWVLIIEPGLVPTGPWMGELNDFLATANDGEAAVFRLATRGGVFAHLATGFVNAQAAWFGKADRRVGLLARRQEIAAGGRYRLSTLPCPIHDRRGSRKQS